MSLSTLAAPRPESDFNGNRAIFEGTRIPVEFLFDHLRIGCTIQDFLREFPSLTYDQVIEAIENNKMPSSSFQNPARPEA